MAKTEQAAPSTQGEWSPLQLLGTGILTLIVALSVIIYLGSRLGGCMYLDGSHGSSEYSKSR